MEVVGTMLDLTAIRSTDVVADLGCGDGRLVIEALRRGAARALCVDIDPRPHRESARERAQRGRGRAHHVLQSGHVRRRAARRERGDAVPLARAQPRAAPQVDARARARRARGLALARHGRLAAQPHACVCAAAAASARSTSGRRPKLRPWKPSRSKPGRIPAAAVIWLHGLGADGHDFEPIVPELRLAKPVRFVFPHAPIRPVTINQGMRMRAWYDIFQFGGGPEDEPGIRASQKLVEELIAAEESRQERSCSPASRRAARSCCRPRCATPSGSPGVMALSTYLPLARRWSRSAARRTTTCRSSWRTASFDDIIPHRPRRAVARAPGEAGLPGDVERVPDAALGLRRGNRATSRTSWLRIL